MMQLDIVPLVAHTGDDNRTVTKNDRVAWSRIPRDDLVKYKTVMDEMLDSLIIPSDVVHGNELCFCEQHVFNITRYYHSLLSILEVADSFLPRKSPHGRYRIYFFEDLKNSLPSLFFHYIGADGCKNKGFRHFLAKESISKCLVWMKIRCSIPSSF